MSMPRSATTSKVSVPSRFKLSCTRNELFHMRNDRNKMDLHISSGAGSNRNYKSRYANKAGHYSAPVSGTSADADTVSQDMSNTDDLKDRDNINTDITLKDGEDGTIDVRARFFPTVSYQASSLNSREQELEEEKDQEHWVVYGTPVIDCRFSLKNLDDKTRYRILSDTRSTMFGGLSTVLFDNHHFDEWLNAPDIDIDLDTLELKGQQVGSSEQETRPSFAVGRGCSTFENIPLTLGLNLNSDFDVDWRPNWILRLPMVTGVTADVEVSLRDEIWRVQKRRDTKRKGMDDHGGRTKLLFNEP